MARLELECNKLKLFNVRKISDSANRSASTFKYYFSCVDSVQQVTINFFLPFCPLLLVLSSLQAVTWPRVGQAAPSGADTTEGL